MHGDPWRWLRRLTHITVRFTDDLPDDEMGRAEFDTDTIVLANGLTQAERRSTCWHEVRHLLRGPVLPHLEAREELAVDMEVALDLIPFEALVDALTWSGDDHEVAEQLTVSVDLVRVRLHGLSEAESKALNSALDENELRIP